MQPAPFLVAGIVNLTPDSFSDGGACALPEKALGRVRALLDEGAHIIDLGAESTRPGAEDIGHSEEWHRLEPVLRATLALRREAQPNDAPRASALCEASVCPAPSCAPARPKAQPFAVSIDTFRAETAAKALELHAALPENASGAGGALPVDIINDISGGLFDPGMDEVLAAHKPGFVLCHSPYRPKVMQDKPEYDDVVAEILHFFESRLAALVKAGLPEECVVLDPGIGFGKNLEHTRAICAAVPRFAALGRPLYFGISRKSFLGHLTGLPVAGRDAATAAATALLGAAGVEIHRVHRVADAVAALELAAFFQPVKDRNGA